MSLGNFCCKIGKFIKSTFIITKLFGMRKATKMLVFNLILNIYPVPRKEEIILTKTQVKMHIVPYDRGISRELKIFKIHEPTATKILIMELRKLKKHINRVTVVDIGSNIGYYSILEMKVLCENGLVINIEPFPKNFLYLLKNIRLNNVNANFRVINAAISDFVGSAKMIFNGGSNWCRILEGDHDADKFQIVTVDVFKGDELFKSFDKINLIRMDVEGHEYRVINGFYNVIRRDLPDLFIEIHPELLGKHKLLSLLSMLKDLGYHVKHFIPRNIDVPLASNGNDDFTVNIAKLISSPPEWSFTLYLEHPFHRFHSDREI